MPEFRTTRQRRFKPRTANQNNKDFTDRHKPVPFESETQAQATTGHVTNDVNGNSLLDSLPTHKEGMNVRTKSTEHINQGDNVTNSIKSSWRNRSNDSSNSMQSAALGVHEHQDNGSDASCGPYRNASSKHSSSDTLKTTLSSDSHVASQEPGVDNGNHVRRNSSVSGQTQSEFRSSSCQRKPANSQNPDNTTQRDFNKRHGHSVPLKTGFNKKRHFSIDTPFQASPYFNIPASHLFHPNTFPYGPQIPHLNVTKHQQLPIWNIGCSQQSPFPFHQLAHGIYQTGKQLKDKNYGNAPKEKYSRNPNQDNSGKTNRSQNRFKSRHYSSAECSGINNPLYKYMAQFEKDVQHSKPGRVTYLPDVRSKGTAGNHRCSDSTGALSTESVKHTVASKYGEKRGNQITKYFEYGEIKSQMENSCVADMKQFLKTLKLDSNINDTRTSISTQSPDDVNTQREYHSTRLSNQTDIQDGVQVRRSTCAGKTNTGRSHPESCDAETKSVFSCNVIEQTNKTRNHPMHTGETFQCQKVSIGTHEISAKSNKHSDLPTLPPYFDPTVHPLQVFQKGRGMDYNHRQLRQSTEKQFPECTSAPRFIPQNANVSDGYSNCAKYNENINYANEHKVPLNVIASNTVNENFKVSTAYNGTSSYTCTDSNSAMNPSSVKDMADVSNPNNGTNSSNPGSMALGSTINEEIEEEMRRAHRMSIPVKHGSERYSPLDSHLNPNANEFSPTLSDCNGNQFTMTEQRGVCYFKRDMGSSLVAHQESNTSYEHEVAEVKVSTSDNILQTYYTGNHAIHKQCDSPLFPTHHQPTESYGSDQPLYSYCTASDPSLFNTSHVVYSTGPQLSPYNPQQIPEPTMPASNQIHPADSYFVANNNYFNEACTPFFTAVQSQANNSLLPSSEVQMHPQSPYSAPGYTCSFVPMYITPSSNPPVAFSGTEYCQVLMQNPSVTGVPFSVSVPAHMSSQIQSSHYSAHMSSQAQPSHYSAPELTATHSAHNYPFQAPVFSLQAYYEANQNNPHGEPNRSDHAVFNTDLSNTPIIQNVGSYANNRQSEQNVHSETTQNENTNITVHAETCHTQPNTHDENSNVYSIDHSNENTIVPVSNVRTDQKNVTRDHNPLEFDECKTLLERLRNREVTLEKCRQNISSESEKRYLVEWLELALRVLERNANKLTIDEMVSVMLVSSQRNKTCIEV